MKQATPLTFVDQMFELQLGRRCSILFSLLLFGLRRSLALRLILLTVRCCRRLLHHTAHKLLRHVETMQPSHLQTN